MKNLVFITALAGLSLTLTGCLSGGLDASALESSSDFAVTGISPTGAVLTGGGTLTVTGSGFDTGLAISLGASPCTGVSVLSATSAQCTIPAHAIATVDVNAQAADGDIAILPNAFAYFSAPPAPTMVSVSPAGGLTIGGTAITITGTGFQTGAGVTIGGSACTSVNVASSTSITCNTPSGSNGAVAIAVTNTDTQSGSLAASYTYRTAPTYTALVSGLLSPKCAGCHPPSGGMNVSTYSSISTRVVAGNPSGSLLYQRLTTTGPLMPQGGPALSASELQQVSDWILAGALNN